MLGERGTGGVTQSSWIRALSSSFVKPWDGRRGRTGGLFGERLGDAGEVLRWSRAQQAAFLIYAWEELRSSINQSNADWLKPVRRAVGVSHDARPKLDEEPGFYNFTSLISTDQGVRGFLLAVNDICYSLASRLRLNDWVLKPVSGPIQDAAISSALKSIEKEPVAKTLQAIGKALSSFDWRTSTAEGLKEKERQLKLAFRGSGGYKELRRQLLQHLVDTKGDIGGAAAKLLKDAA